MIFGELLFCSTIGGFLAAKPHAFAQKIGGQWMNLGNCDTGTRLVAVRTTTSSQFDALEAMRSVFALPRPLQLIRAKLVRDWILIRPSSPAKSSVFIIMDKSLRTLCGGILFLLRVSLSTPFCTLCLAIVYVLVRRMLIHSVLLLHALYGRPFPVLWRRIPRCDCLCDNSNASSPNQSCRQALKVVPFYWCSCHSTIT